MKKLFCSIAAILAYCFVTTTATIQKPTLDTTSTTTQNLSSNKNPQNNQPKKDWNFLVYITANNDLYRFALKNINQMLKVGSSQHINVIVQMDTYGKSEVCRYYVEKNNLIPLNLQSNNLESTSGTPESLYKFVEWSTTNFAAEHQALVIWDHGSGIEDPAGWRKLWQGIEKLEEKGIAFNEIFQTYINNQGLTSALEGISKNLLAGKKVDIVAMDACNMAMLEVGSQIKEYVDFMVGSENVEPGTGWNYELVLKEFQQKTMTPEEFAKHMVNKYREAYYISGIKYTQSAINLNKHAQLEQNIDTVAGFLLSFLSSKDKIKILNQIKRIRNSRMLTTVFPDDAYTSNGNYIDLYHFYKSLLEKLNQLYPSIKDIDKLKSLTFFLYNGLNIILENVIENAASPNLKDTKGVAVYFPTNQIHSSYPKTIFAQDNQWKTFLQKYIKETKQIYGKNKKIL